MAYLLILTLSITYIYSLEKHGHNKTVTYWLITLVPVSFFLLIIPGFQDGIGTDYNAYYDAYYTNYIDLFYNKGEYFFYYLYFFIRHFNLGPQSFFIITALINSIILILTLALFKSFSYKITAIFFIWFVVTNYYNNQMNIIRQFLTVFSFPLIILFILDKRYILAGFTTVAALLSHQIFIVMVVFIGLSFSLKIFFKKKYIFIIFILSIPTYYLVIPDLTYFIIETLTPNYIYYYTGTGLLDNDLIFLVTKLIYIPLFLLFFYIYYSKKGFYSYFISKHKYFDFFIGIFASTALSFILLLFVDRFNRIYTYFVFFSIFPLYYLYYYFIKVKNHLLLLLISLYLFLPYFAKVVIFPVREFSFSTILF